MSLLRLLTTGRSLVGLKDNEGRYRVTNQRLLPKFGSKRNPFRATTPDKVDVESVKAEPTASEPTATEPTAPQPATLPTEVVEHAAAEPEVSEVAVKPAEGPVAAPGASTTTAVRAPEVPARPSSVATAKNPSAALWRWIQGLKAKLSGFGRRSGARPTPPPSLRRPVQAELSLDRIKVVRNDLSDSDLEIVPAKAPSLRDQGRVLGPAKAGASSWSRVGTLLMKGPKRESPKEATK